MLTIDQLLSQLARRELSIDAACTQLDALAAASPDPIHRLIARVQSEIAVGKLAHDAGRRLIAVLESAGDRTVMLGPQTKVHADATVIRSPVTPSPADDDRTLRKGAIDRDATVMRPPVAPADTVQLRPPVADPTLRTAPPDATQLRPPLADPTIRVPPADMTQLRPPTGEPTTRKPPVDSTELRPPLSDPTIRAAPVSSETVIRNMPNPSVVDPPKHHAPASGNVRHDQDVTLRGPRLDQDPTLRAPKPTTDVTLRGKPDVDATLRAPKPDVDATLRGKPDADVTHRGKPDVDATLRGVKPASAMPKREQDATLRAPKPDHDMTVRTLKHDPDATLHTAKHDDATIASTRAYDTRQARPEGSAYAQTLKADGPRFQKYDSEDDDQGPGELHPGSVIKKRFVLETMLGQGGMGSVFSAVDRRKQEAQDPNPRVALKVLNADFARHPQSFIALQREARKAQTLAHPNVVTVFDFDRDGDFVYMTMEMLTGRTLDSIVRETRGSGMKREAALPVIRGIAEGLAYAHRKGFVHSDLKPGNVFITEDKTPKILDFGIARAIPNAAAASSDSFDAGSFGAYTEPYATDEMVAGRDPHPADDLYALGIIAYEMLTGAHPYDRKSAPVARELGLKLAPLKGLKMREARAIERCLSLDRKNRPKDAGEFLKLFRGVTLLQKVTMAAAFVLAVAAGYFWYENYRAINPDRPFESLTLEDQKSFNADIAGADEAMAHVRNGEIYWINSALDLYVDAYGIHPRNKRARSGLDEIATVMLENVPEGTTRREVAQNLLSKLPPHYETNSEVMDAAK